MVEPSKITSETCPGLQNSRGKMLVKVMIVYGTCLASRVLFQVVTGARLDMFIELAIALAIQVILLLPDLLFPVIPRDTAWRTTAVALAPVMAAGLAMIIMTWHGGDASSHASVVVACSMICFVIVKLRLVHGFHSRAVVQDRDMGVLDDSTFLAVVLKRLLHAVGVIGSAALVTGLICWF